MHSLLLNQFVYIPNFYGSHIFQYAEYFNIIINWKVTKLERCLKVN